MGSNPIGTPIPEIEIDASLVHRLLTEQHPDLAELPLHRVDAGWDNVMFRLGDRLCVRLPRRRVAAKLIEHEQTWLPQLPELPIPVPTPYRLGYPGQGYPWRWSVLPWLKGVTADQQEPDHHQAQRLAAFLRSLHVPAPPDAPSNPFRNVPLPDRAAFVEERMQRLAQKTNLMTPEIKRSWNQALNAPMDGEITWIHGDLHPRNVLVEQGVLAGIIDWGDMTAGDRATDLAAIWMLFSKQAVRQQAIVAYGNASEATLQRARGWAVFFGTVLLDTGLVDNPRHAVIGERILQRVAKGYI
ncbi:aminoglycoside phosphotransferase family protein (plasmid) [Kovacikia minuta CCNUW1]|uniref:aminoglycoside phosphotransferase family protein n=1 Tax=Kovacikia minuta TaxID=2931930 RepID=UPI001CCE9CE0|nr:aminoglycoside phosphotransferase family protein [Kovacikia minuta]UBF30218.1 aminoglycoside phosphotransferase family protein [Kovacikia minuta CCNUW1]